MHAQLNHSRGVYNVLTHALHLKKTTKNPNVKKKKSCCKTAILGSTKRKEIIRCLHVSNVVHMLKKDVVFKIKV